MPHVEKVCFLASPNRTPTEKDDMLTFFESGIISSRLWSLGSLLSYVYVLVLVIKKLWSSDRSFFEEEKTPFIQYV